MLSPDPLLARLGGRCVARVSALSLLANRALTLPAQEADRLVTYIVIQALAEWSELSRAALLSSVSGAHTSSGTQVSAGNPKIRGISDVVRLASTLHAPFKRLPTGPIPRRSEPPWHDVKLLVRVFEEAKLSNLNSVRAAVSIGSSVFSSLPPVRNFYAHRSQESKERATKVLTALALPAFKSPTRMLLSSPPRSGKVLLRDWLDDLVVATNLIVA
jgi:hypothetical protein